MCTPEFKKYGCLTSISVNKGRVRKFSHVLQPFYQIFMYLLSQREYAVFMKKVYGWVGFARLDSLGVPLHTTRSAPICPLENYGLMVSRI